MLIDGTVFEGEDCLLILNNAEAAGDPLAATNYPNPFNPATTISFELPAAGHVSVCVFNIIGQQVATLLDEYREAGPQAVVWNGTAPDGTQSANGIYLYRISAGGQSVVRQMILLK